jgi:hypothetical protein
MDADQFNLVNQLPQTRTYSILQNSSRSRYAQIRDQGSAKWNAASRRFLIPLSRRVAALCILAVVFMASGPKPALSQTATPAQTAARTQETRPGMLSGTVLDPAAHAIQSASVVARDESSGVAAASRTVRSIRCSSTAHSIPAPSASRLFSSTPTTSRLTATKLSTIRSGAPAH